MAREQRRYQIDDKMDEVYTGSGGSRALQLPQGLEFFKPPETGGFQIDVIPFEVTATVNNFKPDLRFTDPGKWHWNVIYYIHYGVGPNNDKMVCSASTFFGKPCVVCEERAKFQRSPHKDDAEAAKALRPKERQLLLVRERDPRSQRIAPIQLWEVATFNFLKQLQVFNDPRNPKNFEKYQRFWRFEKGLTLSVYGNKETTGENKYTKYSVTGFEERDTPLPDDTWDHGYDLYGMVRETPYKTGQQMYHGVGDDQVIDDEPPIRNTRERDEEPETPPSRRTESRPEPTKPAAQTKPAAPKANGSMAGGAIAAAGRAGSKKEKYIPQEGDIVIVKAEKEEDRHLGEVRKIDNDKGLVHVKIQSRERPLYLDFDEIEPVPEGDDSWIDNKSGGSAPEQAKPKGKPGKWDGDQE